MVLLECVVERISRLALPLLRQRPDRRAVPGCNVSLPPPDCSRVRPTCSYVYANGKLLGGCDATKALIASGESWPLCTC